MMTLSMMIRVTLGHTGRNVHAATPVAKLLVSAMLVSTIMRIFMPLVDPGQFWLWVGVAGGVWIATFILFTLVFGPLLVSGRADE